MESEPASREAVIGSGPKCPGLGLGPVGADDGGGGGPPALPPRPRARPPPRMPRDARNAAADMIDSHLKNNGIKKYVFLCSVCGGLASLLGTLFLAVYLILRTYTSSLDYFQTVPTYIPAAMLMVTGLSVMCLARRRNRYIFLIKLSGVCCLTCVGACVLVTVTTTVVHMSRLQSLRECVYTLKTQTCTCYSVLLESASDRSDQGARYVFNATPDCEAIHGALYSCLRALFGLSVIGILVCIFCCMLVYQLLSHERKKMYWEQLELRCRYLYGQTSNPAVSRGGGGGGGVPVLGQPATQHCACCQQFRYQQDILTWESHDNRFWNGGQVGNLYSPNPVGEEAVPVAEPAASGWSWRRLPWNRPSQPASASASIMPLPLPLPLPLNSNDSHRSSNGYHQALSCSSPDSQYGFSSDRGRVATVSSGTPSYTTIEPVAAAGCQVYHWGPPPPYSDPNSPSRCPPGPHHHRCQRAAYANSHRETTFNEHPPLSSSRSSSVKSDAAVAERRPPPQRAPDTAVSPKIKYLRAKLQNASVDRPRKRIRENISESEVYFADVSSCNVSVRNDSMSVYEEGDGKISERMATAPDECHNSSRDTLKKQIRPFPSTEDKRPSLQTIRFPLENSRSDNVLRPQEMASLQKLSDNDLNRPGMSMDGSEEDDPELVTFSQRQTSVRARIFPLRNENPNKIMKDETELERGRFLKNQTELPSPMSISSPSTASKCGGCYGEVNNSEHGSSDSVWSEYSPDLLAPDAQYEVIAEHRLTSCEDLNGNPNDGSANPNRPKLYLFSKKRQYPRGVCENWSDDNPACSDNRDFNRHKLGNTPNVNAQQFPDRSKDSIVHKIFRSNNDHCLADILNSPKSNSKNSRLELINHRRMNELPTHCDHSPSSDNGEGIYYAISENNGICCDRTNIGCYNRVCHEQSEALNSQNVSESQECSTPALNVIDRVTLSNSNLVNSIESRECSERFRLESSNRCYEKELRDSELNQVRPVDV